MHGKSSVSAFFLELFANNSLHCLDTYKTVIFKFYGDLVSEQQIYQIYMEAPKLGHLIRQQVNTTHRTNTRNFMSMKELVMTCFTQDIYECFRMLRRGRPLFTHFLDQQHLYIGASVSMREIVHVFQQHLWMGAAECISICEDDFDTQSFFASFDEQNFDSNKDTANTQEMHQICENNTHNRLASHRHLLTVLSDTRCKLPKH